MWNKIFLRQIFTLWTKFSISLFSQPVCSILNDGPTRSFSICLFVFNLNSQLFRYRLSGASMSVNGFLLFILPMHTYRVTFFVPGLVIFLMFAFSFRSGSPWNQRETLPTHKTSQLILWSSEERIKFYIPGRRLSKDDNKIHEMIDYHLVLSSSSWPKTPR